jgi:hypothetical protein
MEIDEENMGEDFPDEDDIQGLDDLDDSEAV